MISEFNRRQTLLALLNFAAGTLALVVATAFFYFVSQFVLSNFGIANSEPISIAISLAGLGIVFISGFRLQAKGEGTYGYQDSDLMPNWEAVSAGNVMVDFYRNRVTAPAHALTQIFLCAPLQLIRGAGRLRSRVPTNPALDQRLGLLLEKINTQDKWQSVSDYADDVETLQYLVHMDAIQFSARTGKLRAKH